MFRILELFFVFACATFVPCFRDACGTQPVPAAEQGATSCGCENLRRAATGETVEDTNSPDPAGIYSRVANEGLSDAQAQVRGEQSVTTQRQLDVRFNTFLWEY